MRHHQTIEENRKQLRRIAAMLAALAGLAERAAGRSRAICFLVLWLLSPAETAARNYLEGLAPGAARLPAPQPLGRNAGAAEALRLANGFRALAAILAALAGERLAWRAGPAMRPRAGHLAPPLRPVRPAVAAAVVRLDSS